MNREASLLHELPLHAALRTPGAAALHDGATTLSYAELAARIDGFAAALSALDVGRGERVAIYLDKRRETVIASFGAAAYGATFVPVNPLLKTDQVAYILADCGVRALVTSSERFASIAQAVEQCPELRHVILVNAPDARDGRSVTIHHWDEILQTAPIRARHRVIDTDVRGDPLHIGEHRQAQGRGAVAPQHGDWRQERSQLPRERCDDVLLAALPLSFDAGFSQLTTAFHAGASVVLLNYLLPKDVVNALVTHRVTGLTAVPPLWIQLTQVTWPREAGARLRYFANTGGRMPLDTLTKLRGLLPRAKPYLMYGLTEAFRATYLPPEEVDRRPDSIGKAIPNCEILVLRPDGTPCDADEPGELVQRGALVAQGYWNDPERTAERFRPLRAARQGWSFQSSPCFSGDTVRKDAEGFLYFVGRVDEMIKSSGYGSVQAKSRKCSTRLESSANARRSAFRTPSSGRSSWAGRERAPW
jgi:acyl-CoA ligase (AMP-forming) (exosortase A-associated)